MPDPINAEGTPIYDALSAEREQARTRSAKRGACPVCGREIGLITPKGGDGSLLVCRLHGPIGNHCPGSGQPCTPTPGGSAP